MNSVVFERRFILIIFNACSVLGAILDFAILDGWVGIGAIYPDASLRIFDITIIERAGVVAAEVNMICCNAVPFAVSLPWAFSSVFA